MPSRNQLKHNKKLVSEDYDYILCDSLEALEHFYKKGLSKKIKVISCSPGILLKKNINSENLFANWSAHKYKTFQTSILSFSHHIFLKVKNKKGIDREEAIISAIVANNFHKLLIKFNQLKKSLLNKKLLFIYINSNFPDAKKINPPWNLLSFNPNFKKISYQPKVLKKFTDKEKKVNILKRLLFGGIETILYRIFILISKIFYNKTNKKLFITSENELSIEICSSLFLRGFTPIDLINLNNKNKFISDSRYNQIWQSIEDLVESKINNISSNTLKKKLLNEFKQQLFKELTVYESWKEVLNRFLEKRKIKYNDKSIVIANHACSLKNLASKNIFNKKGVKMVSFQHGVSAEISDTHSYCLSQHDSSSTDIHIAFNKGSQKVAKDNPFSASKSLISGSPRRYKRQGFISLGLRKYEILFLSNALFKGNTGGLSIWSTDFELAKNELAILEVLEKIKKKIYYKPYPYTFKRYLEDDVFIKYVKKSSYLKLVKENYDARYIIGNTEILICCTATSTLSWALMSNKPLIFLNFKNVAPINKRLYRILKSSVFFIDFDNNFQEKINQLLYMPKKEIIRKWKAKHSNRKLLIDECISTNRDPNLIYKISHL
ncbi:MAG: hypothetical protein CMP24_03885 [Rickettsiales bacterium]|nr:hypothetical protein [Rickettsiales bacterium]